MFAMPCWMRLLNDSNLGVRSGALHALEPVRADSSVRMALQQLAKEDPSEYIRTESQRELAFDADHRLSKGRQIRNGRSQSQGRSGTLNSSRSRQRAKLYVDPLCGCVPWWCCRSPFRCGRSSNRASIATAIPGWRRLPEPCRPRARLHVGTDLGSVQVQGNSPHISYIIRKRSYRAKPGGGPAAVRADAHLRRQGRRDRFHRRPG